MRVRIAIVGIVVGLVVGASAPPAQAADCAQAEQLATFDLGAARAAYLRLVAGDAPPPCAPPGLREVSSQLERVRRLASRAEVAIALGEREEAIDLLARGVALDPANDEIQDLLSTLASEEPSSTSGPFAGAQALLDAGYETEARAAARDVATEKGLPIPDQFGPEEPSEAADVVTWLKDRTADVAVVATAVAILVALAAMSTAVVLKAWRWWVRDRFVTLGTFTALAGKTDDGGEVVKAVVGELLTKAAQAAPTFRHVEPGAVDFDFIELPDQIKGLAKLTQVLFRRETLTVGATARMPSVGSWEITAQVLGRRRPRAQETFSVPAEAGTDLAAAGIWIASWAMFAVRDHQGPRRRGHTRPFGTDRWKSLAWVRTATRDDIAPPQAVRHLHTALDEDPENVEALARLAGELVWSDDPGQVDAGLELVETGCSSLRRSPMSSERTVLGRPRPRHAEFEPLWYQLLYIRQVAHLYRHALELSGAAHHPVPEPTSGDDLERACRTALELARAMAATWLALDDWWRCRIIDPGRRAELKLMLSRDDEYHLGILAAALALRAKDPADDTDAAVTPVAATAASAERRTGRDLWVWVRDYVDREDRDPRELLDWVAHPSNAVAPSTYYNLACGFAMLGDSARSLTFLRRRYEHFYRGNIESEIRGIRNDPSLRNLLQDDGVRDDLDAFFDDLRRRVPPKNPPSGAATPDDRWTVTVVR